MILPPLNTTGRGARFEERGFTQLASNMDNSTTTLPECLSPEGDAEGIPDFLSVSLSLVLPLHLAALAALLACTRIMKVRVAVEHPVFALIFQEVLVLGLGEALMIVLLSSQLLGLRCAWDFLAFQLFLTKLTTQVHQVTWLQVTILRYYLLVYLNGTEVDLVKVRRVSLSLTWPILAVVSWLSMASWYWYASSLGYPMESYYKFGFALRIVGNMAFHVMTNLPDFASITIYLFMKRHFWKVTPAEPAQTLPQLNNNGIFPCDDNISFESGSYYNTDQHDTSHGRQAVLNILRIHAATSLVDLSLDLFRTTMSGIYWKTVFVSVTYLVASFGIPMSVIVGGVKEIRKSLGTLLSLDQTSESIDY